MKEQNKTPERELNKMEISNYQMQSSKHWLSENAPGTHWVFQQLKTQAEMKVILSEISGVDEAKNQINDLEHKKKVRIARRKNFKK